MDPGLSLLERLHLRFGQGSLRHHQEIHIAIQIEVPGSQGAHQIDANEIISDFC